MICWKPDCRREADKRCYNCGQMFCVAHHLACARCLHHVCHDCERLFHTYLSETKPFLSACGEWPTNDRERRQILLRSLKTSLTLPGLFIRYLERIGFTPETDKIYVAITAQQRGDFHKFKWSIASEKHLVALLPLNESYDASWIKDLISRAEALEIVAEGRWLFVHSSLIVSGRNKEGKEAARRGISKGVVLSGLSDTPFNRMKMRLAESTPERPTLDAFGEWASDSKTKQKIYNIDTIVPLYNSDLVIAHRTQFLEQPSEMVVDQKACDALISRLQGQLKDRDALVLWGSRTGGHREYLNNDVPAREFRHKTSKRLLRHLLAASGGVKVRILAGDPLSGVEADVDLTCMWDRAKMKERFAIDHSFSRIDQEYVFYRLAKLCTNTLHIGMQSGNIETLVNNPHTNVICVNENTKGGAGLVNVTRITELRHANVRHGTGSPCHLYLDFNLPVLPSVIGELTRFMMEHYGESITMGAGIRKLIAELNIEVEDTEGAVDKLLVAAGRKLASTSPEQRGSARPNMLGTGREHLVEMLLRYLAAKLEDETERVKEMSDSPDLRTDLQLLRLLAASGRPRVQYAICCLNNVFARPVRSRREIMLGFVIDFVMKHKLFTQYKEKHKGQGGLPSDLEERAKVLVNAFRTEASEVGGHEEEATTLVAIVEKDATPSSTKVKMSNNLKSELTYDPRAALKDEWRVLKTKLHFDKEDEEQLKPVCKLLEL